MLVALLAPPALFCGQREATAEDAAKIPPIPPHGLVVTLSPKGEVTLAWKPSKLESVVAYKVYRKESDGEFKLLKEVKASSFVDKNAPEGAVEYGVSAVDLRRS